VDQKELFYKLFARKFIILIYSPFDLYSIINSKKSKSDQASLKSVHI